MEDRVEQESFSAVEDGIPRWLQHCHEMCCEKDDHCGRQACMIIPQRCNFQTGGLAYDTRPLKLVKLFSHASPGFG